MTRQRQSTGRKLPAWGVQGRTELRRRVVERIEASSLYAGASKHEIRCIARELSDYLMATPVSTWIASTLLAADDAPAPVDEGH